MVQYKTLQGIYNNYLAKYDELLTLDNKPKVNQRHLEFLFIQINRCKNNLNASFT